VGVLDYPEYEKKDTFPRNIFAGDRLCKPCKVRWESDSELGNECWSCGEEGIQTIQKTPNGPRYLAEGIIW